MKKNRGLDRLFLFGPGFGSMNRVGLQVSHVRGRPAIVKALGQASPNAFWMADKPGDAEELLEEAIRLPSRRRRTKFGGLLSLYKPLAESIQPLGDLFAPFVWSPGNFRILPIGELAEVLADEQRGDLFIGGYSDSANQRLTLVRGDLRRVLVPMSIFRPCGTGEVPDSSRLAITDWGNTVRLGNYQAAADTILYLADPEYRKRVTSERRAEDKSFGASLRRLRILRGLRQSDFGDVTAKTIARIERGETAAPHGRTLIIIANRLKVDPSEIISF